VPTPSRSISPTTAFHVVDYFEINYKWFWMEGDCQNGIESTIIGFENEDAVLYRVGSISIEDIERVIGKIKIKNKEENAPNAPGMLSKHYAPATTTFFKSDVAQFIKAFLKKIGLLLLRTN
jgi:L-threonylcarbamoyladenylate synthase